MLTRCTTCNTWFHIEKQALRAAHGKVRCGACGALFNALGTLRESLPPDAFQEQPLEQISAASSDSEPESTAELESVTESETAPEPEPITESAPEISTTVEPEVSESPLRETIEPDSRRTRSRRRPSAKAGWLLGSLILVLLLLAQIVIYEHAALRDNPMTRHAVETLYSTFGHPLPPRHDLTAFIISNAQVTASPDNPGTLIVTATLSNNADFPQAWPLLSVTLTNKIGHTLRKGIFEAKDYLLPNQSGDNQQQASETNKIRLTIADPGSQASGFIIKPCLRNANGVICRAAVD